VKVIRGNKNKNNPDMPTELKSSSMLGKTITQQEQKWRNLHMETVTTDFNNPTDRIMILLKR